MSKLEALGFQGPYSYQADGSVIATFGAHPYNIHSEVTPDAWEAFIADRNTGTLKVSPYSPPPEVILTKEQVIRKDIVTLERTITPRRLREAALGTDGGWLAGIDKLITALRDQLPVTNTSKL